MLLLLAVGVAWIAVSKVPLEAIESRSADLSQPLKGSLSPDFTLETLDGRTMTLSELSGDVVLINFWASWCGPCRREMPAIKQVYEQYRDQGFVVLAVNLQESDAQTAAFANPLGLTSPILMDRDGSAFDCYGGRAVPSTFFVDRSGVIQNVVVGGPLSRPFIESQVTPLLAQEGSE